MSSPKPPRRISGDDFYDAQFFEGYRRIGYPEEWIEEGRQHDPGDAYVISHPSWFSEPMPEVPMVSIYQLFKQTVVAHPDDTAVIFLDKPITYAALDDMIGRYAALLCDLGIKKGDVVATMLPNSLQHLVAFYAAAMIGAVHSPVDVMYQAKEIEAQLRDSGARTILIMDLLYDKIEKLKQEGLIDHIIITRVRDWSKPDARAPRALKIYFDIPKRPMPGAIDMFAAIEKLSPLAEPATVAPKTDPALLLYTAAITGKSKGVIETHFNLVFNSISHAHAFRPSGMEREVNFSIMPMFHTSGYLLHQLPAIYQGGTVILIPIFDVEDSFRIIDTYGVNVIFAPPTFFIALMARKDLMEAYELDRIRVTISCAAPVKKEVQEQWRKMTGLTLINGWGMTETNSGGIISISGIKEKLDSIGVPLYSEVKITDMEGNILARNEEGEICYRGLQVAAGYLNQPDETESTFMPDGWLRTGDRGYIDDEDFVFFSGRMKNIVISSGYNISPLEVEHTLYLHPAVEQAVVVAQPDPKRGESLKAVISLKPEYHGAVTEEDMISFCRENLAAFKVPRIIEFRETLPKSAVGKILRHALRDPE